MIIEFVVGMFLFILCVVLIVQADIAMKEHQAGKALFLFGAAIFVMFIVGSLPF